MQLLEEVLRALGEMGFEKPMPVQRAVFRPMMAGRDLIVQSRTGSGKTAAFGIPMAQGLIDPAQDGAGGHVQALVLGPTRELALQVAHEVGRIGAYRGLRVVPIYGGAPMGRQVDALKAGAQIVSGTPGRVLDHLRRGTLHLDGLRILVLDEADEMLSMGFYEDIVEIIRRCPERRQTLLLSATMPEEVERLARRHMRDPLRLHLSQDFIGVHEITHVYYLVSGVGRPRDLLRVLEVERPESAIIFCNTREETALVAEYLRGQGLDAEAISSDLTQADRERVMRRTKQKRLKYLVATDIAARGIDISDLSHVINYTLPESAEVYIHRTGRTGRAGKSGVAISLVGPRELGNFYYLKLLYKIRPEERSLPSEEEMQTLREGQQLDRLRQELQEEPGLAYRSLLRRVLSADDGERILAALLARHLAAPAAQQPERPEEQERGEQRREDQRQAQKERDGRSERPERRRRREHEAEHAESPRRRRERQAREEGRREPVAEPAPPEQQPSRPPGEHAELEAHPAAEPTAPTPTETSQESRRKRRRGGRGRRRPAAASVASEPGRPLAMPGPDDVIEVDDGQEYWEAWVESRTASADDKAPTASAGSASAEAGSPHTGGRKRRRRRRREGESRLAVGPGQQRLYLNVGRRDGMDGASLAALLSERGLPELTAELHATYTYLLVPRDQVHAVQTALSGYVHAGRTLLCEPARGGREHGGEASPALPSREPEPAQT
ncbi:MAG: DEAD/DEAH box helicase [Myxococcota bacterium]|nr:DEAD/DEAH box helicase [Myxococcota bacterium]